MLRKIWIAGALAAAMVVLGACGNVQEALLEQAVEGVVEQAAGEDIEFNVDDDGLTVSGDDGEIQIGTGALPDGFEFDFADGYEVVSGWRQEQDDSTYFYVQVTYPAEDYQRVVDHIGGMSWPADVSTSETTGSWSSTSWMSSEADKAVTVSLVDDLTVVVVNEGLS